ncbi:DUF6371 domain-containing protein [Hymenobacter fastidiosus]|uniref:DUF6371 domain-containing protein n=1 Tax=Hymenobacter fastidiosus TaxID=486264 RepID=A0ABP7T1W1_9BACT
MHRTDYRFILAPKKETCPACEQPRQYRRYLDSRTGQILPLEYGRCNREIKCAYSLHPYNRPAGGGDSYAWQVEQAERNGHCLTPTIRPYQPRPTPVPPPPVISPPEEVFRATLGQYERNTFARLLGRHFGLGVADGLLTRFHVGTSAHRPGACVYWYIDEQDRVRGGKIMLYDETFHRVKETGDKITWAHTALKESFRRRGQPFPDWLPAYSDTSNLKSPCLFGLPQLRTAAADQPVAIVESEKTAIICTPYMPQFIWLATGSKSSLTTERLQPVKNRRIVLYPDTSAYGKEYQEWTNKAAKLRGQGFNIQVSDFLEKNAPGEQKNKGADIADLILEQWLGYPPSWAATT